MNSRPFVAVTVFICVISALLKVPLVSAAPYIIHGKVTWNRAPVGILVGVSSCVSQLTTDHISVASAPGIITDRSKVAVGVDCIHISVGLRRLNHPSSSLKLHMETVVCCCRCPRSCGFCARCGVCADTEATSLANWGNLNNKQC